ncbi:MAG TPA: hypothetical protein VJ754_05545, partial [Anaerolineae bacterium]|nr:hypothetical protein [Anaerolineae bacterium]
WLLAIPYAVSPNPILATAFVALLNVLAVAGCYTLATHWMVSKQSSVPSVSLWPILPVLIATLLFAAAPWAVIHSRKIWAQNLLPPFVLAWAWTGWLAFVQRRPRALIGHALALAACIQLHYSALWLIPVSLIWSVAFIRRIRWTSALTSLLIFAASFAPFLIADALRGGPSLNRLVEIARQPVTIDDQALRLAWLMIAGQDIHSLAGPQEFQNYLSGAPGSEAGFVLTSVVGVLALLGGLVASVDVLRAARRRAFDERSAAALMMVTWLAVPALLQSRHSLPIFPHYFIILYPAPFMLVGLLVSRLSDTGLAPGRLAAGIFAGLVVLVAALQSAQTLTLQQFVASLATPGGYGVPLERLLQAVDEVVRAKSGVIGAEVLVYAEGDNPQLHEGPAVFDVLLAPDVPRRFIDLAQATEVYPAEAAALIWYSPGTASLPPALARLTRSQAMIPLRIGESPTQVRVWHGRSAASGPCPDAPIIALWQNGVTLLEAGVSGEWRGPGGWIELCYGVSVEQRDIDYHWFNHVMGPDGRRWAQVDGAGYPASSWRVGDVVRLRFGPVALPPDAPPGRYTLRVGMYTYPSVVNVSVLDGAGNSAGDAVSIDLGELNP